MKVKSLEKSTERYASRSSMAFLEGAQSPNWIMGVLSHSGLSKERTLQVLLPLRNYGELARADALFRWLAITEW